MPDHPFRREARNPHRGSTKGTVAMFVRRTWLHPADLIAVGLLAAEEAALH
jgi:hypothetical protein